MKHEQHLHRRILFVLAATTLPLAWALLLFQHWYFERGELADNIESHASVIAGSAAPALSFDDQDAAQEILAALNVVPTVLDAALFRGDGRPFVGFAGREPGANPAALAAQGQKRISFSLADVTVEAPVLEGSRVVGFVVVRASQRRLYREMTSFLIGLAIVAVIVGMIGFAATRGLRGRLVQYQEDLRDSSQKLQQLVKHREQIIEEEHKRIAVEIHDELGQVLTAALLRLRLLEKSLEPTDTALAADVREVESLLDSAYLGMKNIASSLYPSVIAFGFRPALEWLAERLLAPAEIVWRIESPDPAPQLDQTQAVALFRIAQEALTNIVRHAGATRVVIAIARGPQGLVLEVTDDGAGFEPDKRSGGFGFGLMGIRERAQALSGHAEIISGQGKGTTIRVTLPPVG